MTESGSAAIAENDVEDYPAGASLVIDPSGGRCLAPRSPQYRHFTAPRRTLLDVPGDHAWQSVDPGAAMPAIPADRFDDPALAENDGAGIPLDADPHGGPRALAPSQADLWADAAAPVAPTVPGVDTASRPDPAAVNGMTAPVIDRPTEPSGQPQLRRLDAPVTERLEPVVPLEQVPVAPTVEYARPAVAAAPVALVDPSLVPSGYADDVRVDAERSARTTGQAEDSADRTRTIIEWIAVLAGALIVALVIKTFLFQAFYIPSESMEDTLLENDRVLVNKLSYRLHEVGRGDIVVFARPEGLPAADDSDLIKRVMALPGERVRAVDGVLYVNDRPVDEPYLKPGAIISDFPTDDGRTWNGGDRLVGPDEMFVMGDNRDNSSDSRVFGPVPQDLIIGRAFVRVFPLNRIGGL